MAKRKPTKKVEPIEDDGSGLFDEARLKALEATLSDLTKRYGDGTVVRLGEAAHLQVAVIPSGSLTADIALGVGGVPRGRIVEIYGPESSGKTTFCLHVIREAQKRGGLAAFVDMEHALDPTYAARIGVDIEKLYVSQPDTGEQALEITEALVRSGALDVVVVDSVAALVPRAEIEGEMGDSHVGLQARLMSQALRKLSGAIKQSNVSVIFTNQIREKVGVLFGCFNWGTTVMMENGELRRINDIVHQKDSSRVMTFNQETGCFEPKPVVNWFKNGVPVDEFDLNDNEIGEIEQEYQTIIASYPYDRGFTKFSCTPNHEILTPEGYVSAMYLDLGDTIITQYEEMTPSHDLHHLILGSVMGDASIRKKAEHTSMFREAHAPAQRDYLEWKSACFGELSMGVKQTTRGDVTLRTITSGMFDTYKTSFYEDGGRYKRVQPHHVRMLNPFSLAVWYLDDGTRDYDKDSRAYSIAMRSITEEEVPEFIQAFEDTFHITPKIRRNGSFSRINFAREQAERFEQIVAPYVHQSMAKKIRPGIPIGDCLEQLDFGVTTEMRPMASKITEIRRRVNKGKMAVRYNIEVEDNANYIVGNTVVHNSPETTSGGRALKFYASVRMDIRRIQSIKQGGEVVGNRTRIKVKKNKVAPPFREAEFDIMFYEDGISKTGEIVDLATDIGIVEKRGAFYRYQENLLGQGRENTKQFLTENPDVADELENQIRMHFGLPSLTGELVEGGSPKPLGRASSGDDDSSSDDDE